MPPRDHHDDIVTGAAQRRRAPSLAAMATVVQVGALAVVCLLDGGILSRSARTVALGMVGGLLAAGVGLAAGRLQRLSAWLLLIALTASCTAAAVLVLAHLPASGGTSRGVAALVAVVAGLVALVADAVVLGSGLRWWRRLVAVPVAALLVAFVAYPVAVAVYATAQPPAELGGTTPAGEGSTYEEVTLTTVDGVDLSGWYLPSRNGAAVVALHGSSSTRSAVLDHALALNHLGYGVLLFDARGHGLSQGAPMDLGWYGDRDARAAVDHLAARPEVDDHRIGALGMSMGGEQAIGAAAADERIRAVVAEGAQNRTYEDRDDWLPGGVGGWIQRRIDQLTFALVDLVTPASPPIGLREAATTTSVPVLLVAGTAEEPAARSIRLGAPDRVEIWETDTGHIGGLADRGEEWRQRVAGFLDAALAPCTPDGAGC